jgi:branched-chain amino acid transport system permease protein
LRADARLRTKPREGKYRATYLLNSLFSDYASWYAIGIGLLAILATMWFPRGIWGYVSARSGLQLFPVHRRLAIDE